MELKQSNQTLTAGEIIGALRKGHDIVLEQCRVTGDLDLNVLSESGSVPGIEESSESKVLTFSQSLRFQGCIFEGDVVFCGPWQQPDALRVIFEKDVFFNSSIFCGQARFSYSEFRGLAGFDGCTFNRVCAFRHCRFLERTMFRTATLEGYMLFNDAVFAGDTRFTNTCFCKGVNFANVCFEGRPDFSGVYSRSRTVPVYENVRFRRKRYGDAESFWRFIKQVCQESGLYQQAGDCFYQERCAEFWRRFRGSRYTALKPTQKFLRWCWGIRLLPELILGRLLFGYGERPIRVLFAGLVMIIACGFFYSSSTAHLSYQYALQSTHPSEHLTLVEGLYYSTVTFTTLGYGDIYPAADTLTRAVVMFESIAGVCLMALFVVTLAKRYSRG